MNHTEPSSRIEKTLSTMFTIIAVVLAYVSIAFSLLCGQQVPAAPSSCSGNSQNVPPEARYGLPAGEQVNLAGYTLCEYGPASTAWAAYCLDPGQRGNEPRQSFREALSVPSEYRPRLEFYAGWNADHPGQLIDKGHLFFAKAAAYSYKTERACFEARNLVPQADSLNKGPWRQVEEYELSMRDQGWTVRTVCGPLWSPVEGDSFTVQMVGNIPMAPALWKSTLVEKNGRKAMCNWIFPNRNENLPTPDEARVSTDEIERRDRVSLWELVDEPLQSELESQR